jgi:quercetin dioxygenase-like cupin family protein
VLKGGWPHRVINHADTPLRLIELEVANGVHPEEPICGLGGRQCRDGKFASYESGSFTQSTLFETQTVKLARIDLAPGSMSPAHRHAGSHVLLALHEARLQDESLPSQEVILTRGQVVWYGPNVTHSLKNLASHNVRLITLEFK